jgi:hypothetical protein
LPIYSNKLGAIASNRARTSSLQTLFSVSKKPANSRRALTNYYEPKHNPPEVEGQFWGRKPLTFLDPSGGMPMLSVGSSLASMPLTRTGKKGHINRCGLFWINASLPKWGWNRCFDALPRVRHKQWSIGNNASDIVPSFRLRQYCLRLANNQRSSCHRTMRIQQDRARFRAIRLRIDRCLRGVRFTQRPSLPLVSHFLIHFQNLACRFIPGKLLCLLVSSRL